MSIREFQENINRIFGERDKKRGVSKSFNHFVEEVGELAQALRKKDIGDCEGEFADVLAWMMTCANLSGVDVENAVRKYWGRCPSCGENPCGCPEGEGFFDG
ncbi:nucleotide pyrophosphohydrolase [candidate division WOR-3 bacterium]|nr:nucleotide pyrophosphohydrolase [candidate division WOR-3 bacterium]